MRLTSLGHSSVLVDAADTLVLFDPGAFSPTAGDLTGLSAVVVTHTHPDHLDPEKLATLVADNPQARILVEPDLAGRLREEDRFVRVEPFIPGTETYVGGLVLRARGGEHAEIHPEIPRVGNIGVIVGAEGEPSFFHPGDSYEVVEEAVGVDVLGLPLTAPWAKSAETVEFLRAIHPRVAVPIHDAVVSPAGRAVYLNNLRTLVHDVDVRDQVDGEY